VYTLMEAFGFLSDYDAPLFSSWCNASGCFYSTFKGDIATQGL